MVFAASSRTIAAPRGWLGAPWALLGAVFGLGLGIGAWVVCGALVGSLLMVLLLASGIWWVAASWLVLSPTVAVFFNNLLQGIPFFRAERLLVLLLLAMLASQVVFRKRRLPLLLPVERRMLAFLALGSVHVLYALRDRSVADWSKQVAALLFDGYLMPMAGFFIARRLGWDAPRARRFLWLMAAASLFLAVTAPLETLLKIGWFIPTYLDVIHVYQRATGTFGNAAAYGAVMGSLLLLAALLYTQTRPAAQRLLLLALLLLVLGAIALSKTRASWIGVAAGLAFVFVRDPRSRPLLMAFGIGAALAAAVALPLLLALHGFQDRVTDSAPVYNRIAGWGTAANMMLQNPLTGLGVSRISFGLHRGEYAIEVGDVSGAWIRELAVPHNEFLNVGAMMGLLGFVLYLRVFTAMFSTLRAIWQRHEARFTQAVAVYVCAIWISWCVNACFADFANLGYVNVLLYFVAGMAVALADHPSPPNKEPA